MSDRYNSIPLPKDIALLIVKIEDDIEIDLKERYKECKLVCIAFEVMIVMLLLMVMFYHNSLILAGILGLIYCWLMRKLCVVSHELINQNAI